MNIKMIKEMRLLREMLEEMDEIEIENLDMDVDEFDIELLPQMIIKRVIELRKGIKPFKFKSLTEKFKYRISEVTLGATSDNGGTRDRELKIGGETSMPAYFFNGEFPNYIVISQDVFDIPIPLPSFVREHFKDSISDPSEWAKLRVKKFNAEMITLHMVSTDPLVNDTPIKEACKTIEDVLQAVKVPVIIGGSGNPEKDPELLEKAAEICHGEKVLLSSVDLDMDYKRVANAAIKYDHSILSLISMNPDEMRRLNRNLMNIGVKEDHIVMDLFTGGVGYGIEYSISAMERCRLAGLKGDKSLSMPIASATSNAWSAREAWMKNDEWGPRELRGPLWESITALIAMLSGADLFMMLDPSAIKMVRIASEYIFGKEKPSDEFEYRSWIKI